MNEADEQDSRARREAAGEQGREAQAVSQAPEAMAARLAEREADLQALAAQHERSMAAKDRTIRALELKVAAREQAVAALTAALRAEETRRKALEQTMGWKVLRTLQSTRGFLAPPDSSRERLVEWALNRRNRAHQTGRGAAAQPVDGSSERNFPVEVEPVRERPALLARQAAVDIVICVHNALVDVQRCLASVTACSEPPYSLIVVDDGSAEETRAFLAVWCPAHGARLLRNEQALGYTRAANQGLQASAADYVVLLNSDTVVTSSWLERLVACAASDPCIGLAGPLSNTASWQSIPELFDPDGDWAPNPLPGGVDVALMGELVAKYSARLYPVVPLLNGFCLLIRRTLLQDVGYFDEATFGAGYGEEDDYGLRARAAGWSLAVADDAYVYHAQSRSYSHAQRQSLTERAGAALAQKHGQEAVQRSVTRMREDRVLAGVRARSRVMCERQDCLAEGRARFAGRRLLFLLPVREPGGGANVIITEAMAMREMGVEVTLFNLKINRASFTTGYPNLELPVMFGEMEWPAEMGRRYDAVIATVNFTVDWLAGIEPREARPVRGYYVQGFEPLIYAPGTPGYERAWRSYIRLPDLVRFTKTDWTRRQVLDNLGVESAVVGPSVDVDLFRPRPRAGQEAAQRPVRIAAMIRPSTPVRSPEATLSILGGIARRYGSQVEICTFGAQPDDPGLVGLPADFRRQVAGVLTEQQVANFLNQADIFVDFSSHQAMGLTALEAMACGAAVIVPASGGAVSFARHGLNALVVDTSSEKACEDALAELVEDRALRAGLQSQATADAADYYPERPAFNILNALFADGHGPER